MESKAGTGAVELPGYNRVDDDEIDTNSLPKLKGVKGAVTKHWYDRGQEADVPEVELDELGNVIEQPKPVDKKKATTKTAKTQQVTQEDLGALPPLTAQDIAPRPVNNYQISVHTDFGVMECDAYDVSTNTDGLLAIAYHKGIRSNKFIPKKSENSLRIVIKNVNNDEETDLDVSPLGLNFILSESELEVTLLEIVK